MKKLISAVALLISCSIITQAQLTKNFNIVNLPDNYTLKFEGDKNTHINFKWTNADLYKPEVILTYSIQIDTIGGDFSNPIILIGSACCANVFKDTTADISFDFLAGEIAAAMDKRYKKTFKQGETITLDWIVMANAAGPLATYENRATPTQRITFVRGQFDQEYVPVKLVAPLDNSSLFVEDNDVVKLKFGWTKAYCPTGCSAPEYQIMFDDLSGDFSAPLYYFSIPQSPFDTILDLRQDVLAQMMYDDGVAYNTPKTYKWAVKVFGNGQEVNTNSRKVSLLRGLMKFEHIPFRTKSPVDNAVYVLQGDQNDSIKFTWTKTRTGYPDAARYNILFDTAKTAPDFSKPLFKLATVPGDTTFTARFLVLRDSMDKKYGKKWFTAALKWTVQADIIGYKYMSEDTNDLRLTRGFFTGTGQINRSLEALAVYPNPATNSIFISAGAAFETLEVTDVTGRQVITLKSVSADQSVDISGLASGMYYIIARQKNGVSLPPCRFVKQ